VHHTTAVLAMRLALKVVHALNFERLWRELYKMAETHTVPPAMQVCVYTRKSNSSTKQQGMQ
jgi:hypothetical protein